jgi:DNA mismatch repair protein MutS2
MEAGRIWSRGIEWDAVRALLAREAQTPMGRERAGVTEPLLDVSAVRSELASTTQARRTLAEIGAPPLDTVPDIRQILEHCQLPGSVLDGVELVSLRAALEAAPRLIAWGRATEAVAAELAALAIALPRTGDLHDLLRRALDDDGAVRDDASSRLRQLRREIRDRRQRLVAELERMLAGAEADRLYADRFVTLRHGRYVVPVRAEARGRVRGIVHDRSQSEQTVFMEPADVVEANNDLVQLAREEEAETARILAELTDAVRARLDDLGRLVETVARLDLIFARARLAERMDATAPVVGAERRIAIRGARHPLLLAQSWEHPDRPVVPADIEIDPERPVVVITGPNAGGKTIALKTLALHALMAQSGCHIPAEDGSSLPVFTRLHAIIGDDQSVAENLSTFSAFVKQVREILAEADDRSLVLLDELGAGTDPDEGAALAQAILEALVERGALVMATTHLEPLKAFASTHPRARNASVEFDTTSLAPTFRLRYDRPGQSLALTIAARLGLSPELIARAESHRSLHATRLSELLRWLDEYTRCEAERTIAIERREQETAARLATAREAEATAERKAREIVARAKEEATRLLGDIRRAIGAEWDRLKRPERSRRDLDDSRRRLREAAARAMPDPAPLPAEAARELVPGAAVAADHLGLKGDLVAITGDTATVRSGAITVRVPLTALRPISVGTAGNGSEGGVATPRETRFLRGNKPRGPMANGNVTDGADLVVERGVATPPSRAISAELMLIGKRTDEARDMVEQYLDDAFMAALPTVRLVHGKGTGALRKAVRDLLAAHPLVESYRDGEPSEGGAGATVAALKVN